jgi:hypothetical protein
MRLDILPDAWRDLVHPRRGGRFVPEISTDRMPAWRLMDEFHDTAVEILERRGEHLANARDYLDHRIGEPYDAAVVATIIHWALDKQGRAPEIAAFVDAWVAEHGLTFAARAVMARQPIHMNDSALCRHENGIPLRDFDGAIETMAGRLRGHLAVAAEKDHQAAVDALGQYRTTDHDLLVTAFLVPERTDWFAAPTRYPWPHLLEAVSDLAELTELGAEPSHLFRQPTTVPTLVATLGPAIVPYLADTYGEEIQPVLALISKERLNRAEPS